MKKQKVQAKINLEALAGGAFAEKLNEALMQVAENIQNPNTEAKPIFTTDTWTTWRCSILTRPR